MQIKENIEISMKQKPKLFLFIYQILCGVIFFFVLFGCGLPNDSIRNIDKNIEEIKEVVKDDGVQIIIKESSLDELSVRDFNELFEKLNNLELFNNDRDVAERLSEFGVEDPEDLFRDESTEDILQSFKSRLEEHLEKMEPEDNRREVIREIIEQIDQALSDDNLGP